MKVRISGNGGHRDINLPLKDAELAWLIKRVGDGTDNLWCRLEKTWGERNPLQELAGQTVNMDEVNFFAKRMESFTAYEQGVLELYAQEQGLKTMKDLINLTYSMKGLSLITDFSDGREVGKRLYMDEHLGISEEESRQTDFEAYGKKVLAEGNCRILPCGVFVMQGFKMQEVYNGRTFPEYIYDTDQTVAVLKIKNKEGSRDYLYLPTDIYSVNMMKERLRVQDLWECSVEEVHNLRLPHIDYAGVAADKRNGTLAVSGYVSGGFVGTQRETHEYLQYKGEFASPLEKDADCYQKFCLYSPLTGGLVVDGEDAGNLYRSDLMPYAEEIERAVCEDECVTEEVRGLMHYFDCDREVAAKVASAWPSVKEVEGELYGVLICEIAEPLTEREIGVLKDYWTGQMSDGWGEGFEQQPIRIEEGELYVSFWSSEDFWKVMTAEELGIEQEQEMEMSF